MHTLSSSLDVDRLILLMHREDTAKETQASRHSKSHQAITQAATHNIRLAQRTHRKLTVFINNSPSTFVNTLYIKYMKTHEAGEGDTNIIEAPLERVLRWQQRLDKCAGVVLQECGVGMELQVIDAVRKTAGLVV